MKTSDLIRAAFLSLMALTASAAGAAEPAPIRTVAHVHSAYSGRKAPDIRTTLELARRRGIEAVIFTDDAIADFEFGLWPLRGLVKASENRVSVLRTGPSVYLEHIASLRAAFPEMIIIPGVEAAPFYYWSGDPLAGLTINDWNRHLTVAGLEKPEDYEGLPVLGNRRDGRFDAWSLWPILLLAGAAALWKARWRKSSGAMGVAGIVFLLNNSPFQSPHFSQYDPSAGWKPYETLAAYADEKGLLCFWNHAEAPNWQTPRRIGPRVFTRTLPYPDCLRAAPRTDGFGALLEGDRTMTRPGGEWDQALSDYLNGRRGKAPWGFGEIDYVGEGARGLSITSVSMDVHASSKSASALLDALKAGRFETIAPENDRALALKAWRVEGAGRSAGSGETLKNVAHPVIHLSLTPVGAGTMTARVSLIRNGIIIFRETVPVPFSRAIPDDLGDEKRVSYRLDARFGANGALLSNPIFVFNDSP